MNANLRSTNPVDGTVLWQGNTTDTAQVAEVMQAAHQAHTRWRQTSLQRRIEIVRRYGEELTAHSDQLAKLISDETGKLPWDAAGEVKASIAKVELSIRALQERRLDQLTAADNGDAPQRHVRYVPLGVAVVLGPFNFPLHLPGGQIIPALLAGNTVVFKPSEQAMAIAQWKADAWQRAGLPEGTLHLILGGVETAVAAIDSPHTAAVFLTGSLAAGRAIHRQLAGRPEVMLALELGGNNPVVVLPDADPIKSARLLCFSAFITSGQRCTCARRAILVQGDNTDQQITAVLDAARQLRTGLAGDDPPAQIGPLINAHAVERIRRTYLELQALGCEPLIPLDVSDRADCLLSPIVMLADNLDERARHELGATEWFGPLLVIQRAADFDTALQMAADTPYGLAAALLGGDASQFERFASDVGAGVVNWNGPTTGAAGVMPFGGLGTSGNHRPAGYFAIDACNDPVASLERTSIAEADPWNIVK